MKLPITVATHRTHKHERTPLAPFVGAAYYIYRGRVCCVCELKFEAHDFLRHIRAAGHHGDSRGTVHTPGSAPIDDTIIMRGTDRFINNVSIYIKHISLKLKQGLVLQKFSDNNASLLAFRMNIGGNKETVLIPISHIKRIKSVLNATVLSNCAHLLTVFRHNRTI